MHYCCLVITKEFPTDEVLNKVLAPFQEDVVYEQPEETRSYPAFTWDWWRVGGRYSGKLKLRANIDDEKYKWQFVANEPRNGRLFRSNLLTKMEQLSKKSREYYFYTEDDYFTSMGFRDGYLYVDAAFADDVINIDDLDCYCCLTPDGSAFARSSWDGNDFNEDADFDSKQKSAIRNSAGNYLCFVDLHD